MSLKVDFLPAGLLLFLVSWVYVVGYNHPVEWEFCRSPPICPGYSLCVIHVHLTHSVAFALVELLPVSLGHAKEGIWPSTGLAVSCQCMFFSNVSWVGALIPQ